MVLAAQAPAWGQAYCVRKNGVELKKSPSAQAPTSWKVGKYMPLQGTGKTQSGYAQVRDMDGEEHWVRLRDVRVTTNCLVIRVRQSILREGPGERYPAATVASSDRYSPYKDLGNGEDGWTQVQDDMGSKAWVNLDHCWRPRMSKIRMSFEPDR